MKLAGTAAEIAGDRKMVLPTKETPPMTIPATWRDVPVRLARLPIADPPSTGRPHAWTHRHTGACDSPQDIPCYFHDAGNCRAAHRCPTRRPVRARHAVPSQEPRP